MNKYFHEYNSLIESASNYLEYEMNYSKKTTLYYYNIWRKIRAYIFDNGYTKYCEKIGEEFILNKFGTTDKKSRPRRDHITFIAVSFLNQYYQTGKIETPKVKSKYPLIFNGEIGNKINLFIDIKRTNRMSRTNIQEHQRNLFEFLTYCNKMNVKNTTELDTLLLLNFIQQFPNSHKTNMEVLLRCLRGFMKFLYESKYTKTDYSIKIPKAKKITQPKIPSVYSKKEIKTLLNSIDRSTAVGKRNYAIIIIATRLGLRASDISKLKLDNLNWGTNTISFFQVKTGKDLVLPLFADIGNAIIDYLKYGRPETLERNIFLTARPPITSFKTSNIITHVVQRAFIKANLKSKDRKFGPHALRHSLSSRMLEKSTTITVITEVLGHEDSKSTSYYLRIDLESMKQCTLNIPPISTNFYTQKGGAFYG